MTTYPLTHVRCMSTTIARLLTGIFLLPLLTTSLPSIPECTLIHGGPLLLPTFPCPPISLLPFLTMTFLPG